MDNATTAQKEFGLPEPLWVPKQAGVNLGGAPLLCFSLPDGGRLAVGVPTGQIALYNILP